MRLICSWCSRLIGNRDDGESGESHGVCRACAEKLLAELDEMKKSNDEGFDRNKEPDLEYVETLGV